MSSQIGTVTVDLIERAPINITIREKILEIPGGNPVIKPVSLTGKTVTFNITLYADTFENLRTKMKNLEDFVEQNAYQVVSITCGPDPDLSGNYILISLDGGTDERTYGVARYTLQARRVYS